MCNSLGYINVTSDMGKVSVWEVDETVEPIYSGMSAIKIDFLDVDAFEYWSDLIIGCGALPEFEIATLTVLRNFMPMQLFGIEVFKIIETANWEKMQINLFGYFLDGDTE